MLSSIELYTEILEYLPLEVFCFDQAGSILFANRTACKSLKYKKKEVYQKSIFDINIAVTPESWSAHWQETRAKKQHTFKATHSDSEGLHFEVEVTAHFFSYLRKDVLVAFVRNITESNFYREVLLKSEALAQVGGWKWNLQDNSFLATEEALRLFDVKNKDLLHPHRFVNCLKDKDLFTHLCAEAITRQRGFQEVFETLETPKRYVRIIVEPKLKKDKVYKLFGVYQDITPEKEREIDLTFFKRVLDSAKDLVYIYNREGKLLYCNDAVVHELGYTREELKGFFIYDLDGGITPEWWVSHFKEMKEKKVLNFEWLITRKNNTKFPADITANYLDYNGEAINCAVVRDITEKKMRDLALHEALQEVRTLKRQTDEENEYLQEEVKRKFNHGRIISVSDSYQKTLKALYQVAPTDATVLITGESGTGKELLATAIHEQSQRRAKTLIKVNCATLPKNLFESEFFGHKKGAFTGAVKDQIGKFKLADGGTLFLDEIGELPLDLQPKLLRILQEGEFDELGGKTNVKTDVRIVAATNRNLEKMVKEGEFREDLYYRLNVFPIHSLPLRERQEDIPVLAQFFLEKYAKKNGKALTKISTEVLNYFKKYNFPGNIRELENIIERATITEDGKTLQKGAWLPVLPDAQTADSTLLTLEEVQRKHILRALKKANWKVSGKGGAAEILDINPKTLFGKMKKLNIKSKP